MKCFVKSINLDFLYIKLNFKEKAGKAMSDKGMIGYNSDVIQRL